MHDVLTGCRDAKSIWRTILALALAGGLLTTGCGTEDKPPSVVATGEPALTIGIDYDQPGLSVMGKDGKPVGFDADTARYIADRLDVKIEKVTWKQARPDQREQMLNSGAVDFIVAAYSITPERQRQVSFAGPYLVVGQDLLVRTEQTGIEGPEDLDERTVCAPTGSTSAEWIQRHFATGAKPVTRESVSACVDELLAGTVDAVTTDDVILAGFAARHPGKLRVVGHPFARDRYGVGVKKGNTELQGKITSAIREMIADGSWERFMTADIAPSGYRPVPPPPVFNAPDQPVVAGDPNSLDPELVRAVDTLAATANARDWEGFSQHVCPESRDAVDQFVLRYTPQYDDTLGDEVKSAGFTYTITGIAQTGPDAATFLAHETFTDVPDKYRDYVEDIDLTGTMQRRDGQWLLCGLAADFAES
ncbi:glutamate ABC transporter substrate-binding protein [Nocardia sp. NPDC050406]|uniref:glutamate ABC transporter substrate-binding protein n=1 Tax=Nocardia sp. NPDC050406 TaxID=3364318 RepID=UPI00378E5DFB